MCHDTSFFVFARNTKPSSRHITRFGHFSPPYKTRSPLPRVAHRHFDPQCTAPPLASFQNAKLHIVMRTVAWTFQSPSSTNLPTISMVFSWLCQKLNRSNSDKTQDIVRLLEWLHLLRRVHQLHQKPRLRESLRPHSILASSVPKTTPEPVRGSSHLTNFPRVPRSLRYPCVKLWMFKCAVVGCAVVKASVVSDADNRRKTCAT